MSDKNKDNIISKAILLTIRGIEESALFKSVEPVCSKPLFDFFIELNDVFTAWLKLEIKSTVDSEKTDGSCSAKSSFDVTTFLNDWESQRDHLTPLVRNLEKEFNDSFLEAFNSGEIDSLQMILCYIETADNGSYECLSAFLKKHNISIPPQSQETYGNPKFSDDVYNKIKETDINAKTTHCDKEDGAKVKHRLGIYCNEKEDKVVCAVYPWSGERKNDHDEKWMKALVEAVIDKYPKIESLILVCHDGDFNQYDRQDTIVSDDYNQIINDKFKNKKDEYIKIPFVVFQHATTSCIPDAINTDVTNAYKIIEQHVYGHSKFMKADKDNMNAHVHNTTYPNNKEQERK